jgi:hypothetical protein
VMKPHAERASSVEDSYRDAVGYAKEHARDSMASFTVSKKAFAR